jgi:hypothetical protein
MNVETKEQRKNCMHIHLPKEPKRFKQTLPACLPARKLMETVFWDWKAVLMMEFI